MPGAEFGSAAAAALAGAVDGSAVKLRGVVGCVGVGRAPERAMALTGGVAVCVGLFAGVVVFVGVLLTVNVGVTLNVCAGVGVELGGTVFVGDTVDVLVGVFDGVAVGPRTLMVPDTGVQTGLPSLNWHPFTGGPWPVQPSAEKTKPVEPAPLP